MLPRLLWIPLLAWLSTSALAQRVAFINPGRSDEVFWRSAGQAMQAAADSLGMRFEQQFAERDPAQVQVLADQIAARPAAERPDYVILVNEKGVLVPAAQRLQAAGIKSFAAFSGLLPQERARHAPRKGLRLLLGSLEPQAEHAGFMTAHALLARARQLGLRDPDGRIRLLAIAGDRSTPVSIARNDGMRRAVAEAGDAVLDQVLFADWKREMARERMAQRLQQGIVPQLVWAGSDQMAFGAMEAAQAQGLRAGRDLLFSGINTSAEAMQAVVDGRLAALSGGHFLCGAWALVMLYDHHRGFDFKSEGLELQRPMFILFDAARARQFQQRFGEGQNLRLDFRAFSKALNPGLKRYPFKLEGLLKAGGRSE